MASMAMFTAVSKPNVKSVAPRSLSMVFGTPTTLTPRSLSLVATPSVSLAADGHERVDAVRCQVRLDLLDRRRRS